MSEKREERKELDMVMIDTRSPPPGYQEAIKNGPPFNFKNVQNPSQQGPRPWRPPAPGALPMPDNRVGYNSYNPQMGQRPGVPFRGRGQGRGPGRGQGRGVGRGFRGGGFRGFRGKPRPNFQPMGHGAPPQDG